MSGIKGQKRGVKYTPLKVGGPGCALSPDEIATITESWLTHMLELLTNNPTGYKHNELARLLGCSFDKLESLIDQLEVRGVMVMVDEDNRYQLATWLNERPGRPTIAGLPARRVQGDYATRILSFGVYQYGNGKVPNATRY